MKEFLSRKFPACSVVLEILEIFTRRKTYLGIDPSVNMKPAVSYGWTHRDRGLTYLRTKAVQIPGDDGEMTDRGIKDDQHPPRRIRYYIVE